MNKNKEIDVVENSNNEVSSKLDDKPAESLNNYNYANRDDDEEIEETKNSYKPVKSVVFVPVQRDPEIIASRWLKIFIQATFENLKLDFLDMF